GAYGGKREIMELVAPIGPMYQAGTLSGNPIAMSAGLEMLRQIKKKTDLYSQLNQAGIELAEGLRKQVSELGLNYTVNQIGSMYSLFFTSEQVIDLSSAKSSNTVLFGKYFHAMLQKGIYLAPSQFESMFLSTKIETKIIKKILKASQASLETIHA
ncbi:MAG: aminotransferase class III-fold pyridoxal phosphate-dependent enzyme, partial [Leadbetterella sp.]